MRRAFLAFVVVLAGCVGPTHSPVPIEPGSTGSGGRLVLDQTYVAGVMGSEYILPHGTYRAEASDSRGVYYRAPIPLKRRGLLGGLLGRDESLVEGGIYVPNSSFWIVQWLYVYEEGGRIRSDTLPRSFRMSEGRLWRVVPEGE